MINKSWQCNLECGNSSQQHCIPTLKVATKYEKFSLQGKKLTLHGGRPHHVKVTRHCGDHVAMYIQMSNHYVVHLKLMYFMSIILQ